MSPWTLLGWIIVGIVVFNISLAILLFLKAVCQKVFFPWIIRMYLHLKTRNIAPEEGQLWDQGTDLLTGWASYIRITRITDEGRICMTSGNAGWSDSPEDWKKRLKHRRMFLVLSKKKG